jgi:RND superfamily putative drug exporter
MLLVPATMKLLGHKNWWIPKWLDKILPNLVVEPTDDESPVESTDPVPEPV